MSRSTPGAILQPQPPPWAKEVSRGSVEGVEVMREIYHAPLEPALYDDRFSVAHTRAYSESCLEVSFAEEIQSLLFVRNATRVNKP
jgi:hypothetical protein